VIGGSVPSQDQEFLAKKDMGSDFEDLGLYFSGRSMVSEVVFLELGLECKCPSRDV
jgi:hypothetical protein